MKRAFTAFFFSLLLSLSISAGGQADWTSHLNYLSAQTGENQKGLAGALQLFSGLDAPKTSDLLKAYDSAAEIAQTYPEKKSIILNLVFRHFDFWLGTHPTETPSVEELKTLLGYVRRVEGDRQPVEGDQNSQNLDLAFQVAMRVAFQRTLRLSVTRASEIADILDADFPRTLAGAKFRRELCALSVDRFVALGPLLKDIRRMVGHVGAASDLAEQRGDFLGILRETSLRAMEASEVKNQKRVAKLARAEKWIKEGEIFLLALLAKIDFKDESDLRAVFVDVAEQFSKAEADLGLTHGRAILLHHLYYLKQVALGQYSATTAFATLDYPGFVLKQWYLGNGTMPHDGEEYAIDPSPKWGSRFRVATQMETTLKAKLRNVKSLEEVLNRENGILQFSAFPSLDMEEAKWNAMVGFVPKLMVLNPDFRQLINYLALVPRANVPGISRLWVAEKESKDSNAVKLARVLIGLAKLPQVTTDKVDEPLHREAVLLMGRLLLLNSLRSEELNSNDLPVLLKTALGEDFAKLKQTSTGFLYKDFWSRPLVSRLVALAKACGLASTRYPYPPL